MKIHIGLVGEKGSGKETFVKIIKEITGEVKVMHCRFSDVLKETLIIWGLDLTRKNFQILPQVMRPGYGMDVLSQAVKKRALEAGIEKEIIILDGIRWLEDVQMLRILPNNILVYVTADMLVRYERVKNRKGKAGEQNMTFEQFYSEEKEATEILIPKIGQENANLKIENNGTLEEFEKKVKEFYEMVIKNGSK